jgi:hypothetical protein
MLKTLEGARERLRSGSTAVPHRAVARRAPPSGAHKRAPEIALRLRVATVRTARATAFGDPARATSGPRRIEQYDHQSQEERNGCEEDPRYEAGLGQLPAHPPPP